jgi:hypothetical protein
MCSNAGDRSVLGTAANEENIGTFDEGYHTCFKTLRTKKIKIPTISTKTKPSSVKRSSRVGSQ